MQRAVPSGSGADLFSEHLDLIERVIAFVCARHHMSGADADDFGGDVRLKLIENDYAVLTKFQGRSTLRTYLTIVIQRLFLDHRIRSWGKWRPSAEATRLGPIAVQFEQLLSKDNYTVDQACELLKTKHGVTMPREELEQLAGQLPPRTPRRFETDDALADVPSTEGPPDAAMAATRVSQSLQAALSSLDPQDRLIMALRFEDGRNVSEIAAIVGVDAQRLYRRIDRMLKQMRGALEAAGVDSSSLTEAFERAAVSIEWRNDTERKNRQPRPSIAEGTSGWR